MSERRKLVLIPTRIKVPKITVTHSEIKNKSIEAPNVLKFICLPVFLNPLLIMVLLVLKTS